MKSPTGNITTEDYGSNWFCSWIIAPDNASIVTLSFSSFQTEAPAFATIGDWAFVYECADITCRLVNLLGKFAGTLDKIPGKLVSTTGIMRVQFFSDPTWTFSGFRAFYSAPCPAGSYGPTFQQCTACRSECPLGKTLDRSACLSYGSNSNANCACPAGQYSNNVESPCIRCPISCAKGEERAEEIARDIADSFRLYGLLPSHTPC